MYVMASGHAKVMPNLISHNERWDCSYDTECCYAFILNTKDLCIVELSIHVGVMKIIQHPNIYRIIAAHIFFLLIIIEKDCC